jgi:hypothetical protein
MKHSGYRVLEPAQRGRAPTPGFEEVGAGPTTRDLILA